MFLRLCPLVILAWGTLASAAPGQLPAPSLDPRAPFSRYQHHKWDGSDGLPQNTVDTIVATPDGYLWLATQDGLARFDGVRFVVFDKATTPQFTTNDITVLTVDGRGHLWVGTAGGGLLQYTENGFTALTTSDGLSDGTITDLYAAPDGTLWIGTRNGGLSRLSNGRFATMTTADGLPGNDITALAGDGRGGLWIGTRVGLVHMVDGRVTAHSLRGAGTSDDVRALAVAADGTLWIGTTRGAARLRDGRVSAFHADTVGRDFIGALLLDRAGTLWVGTRGGGLVRVSETGVSRMRAADGLSEDDVIALYEDPHGALWIGCNTGGLNRLARPVLTSYGKAEGVSHDTALPIAADRSGAMWVGTYGGGVNRFKDGQWSSYTVRHGLSSDQILSLYPARDGSVWIGTRRGLDRFHDGVITAHGDRIGVAGTPVLSLLETRAGEIWIGSPTGLIKVAGDVVSRFTTADGLSADYVSVLYEDRHGTLWVGTEGGGLSRREGENRFVPYSSTDGFPAEIVWAIYEDVEGALWFGTNGHGLIRLRDGRFTTYTTRNGLFNDTIFQILEDAGGYFWMSSQRGISRVRRSDFAALDAGQLARVTATSYGEGDGMRSAEANGGVQPAGSRAADGTLWFPTIKGVVVVDPLRAVDTAGIRVLLEEVFIDGQSRDPRLRATAAPGARDYTFRYTALGGPVPGRTHFRYRLEGFETAWVYVGRERKVQYMNLPPGDYRFQVEAEGAAGQAATAQAAFAFVVAPHFYQTFWFYLACVCGVLMVGGMFYAVRVGTLKAGHREIAALAAARGRALDENASLMAQVDEQRRRFEHLLATVPGIVWELYGPDAGQQRVSYVSAHVEVMLGYSVQEWLDTPDFWLTIVHPDDRDQAARTSAIHLAAGSGAQQFRWIARDGRIVHVESRYSTIRDTAGVPIGSRGVTMDIGDRQQLEEQLRQAQKMEAVGRLAGGIAHDFNNLLTAIIGHGEMLSEAVDTTQPEVVESLAEIRTAADRAAGLTRQLLAFSRRQVLAPTILDLGDLVEKTSGLLRRLIGEDIEFSIGVERGEWLVLADRGQIEQVVMNLAVNARDAMPTGGTLTIDVTGTTVDAGDAGRLADIAPGRYVMLALTDTGHGMDADTQTRIFEPFFTTKERGKGTGLGLSTVFGIVKQSGGHIQVDSEPGCGTTFRVFLPQVEGAPTVVEPTPSAEVVPGGSETVLVVEDEPRVRALACQILSRNGYTVLEAQNGEDALQMAAQYDGAIDLIVVDCVMPGVSGTVLADQLTATRPAVQLLFMSGYTDHEATRIGLARAGARFLQKPFTPGQLARCVRSVLDNTPIEEG